VRELAAGDRRAERRLRLRAGRHLRAIAANPSPTALALLYVAVTRIFQRVFERLEVTGLERVTEAAKLHPLVLVPTHRSHFDYLILSWLFYEQHLVPPLVAAGDNLAFWPLGPVLRRGGGYFLRRSFEGDRLYTTVFRRYVQQLIKDGATQEFFIEGTRSRSGRTLPPRLGMLGMVLEAYARGVRRDLYLVPVGCAPARCCASATAWRACVSASRSRWRSGWRRIARRWPRRARRGSRSGGARSAPRASRSAAA
jgi:glycerol-3-phosphate O-acyltransferase